MHHAGAFCHRAVVHTTRTVHAGRLAVCDRTVPYALDADAFGRASTKIGMTLVSPCFVIA